MVLANDPTPIISIRYLRAPTSTYSLHLLYNKFDARGDSLQGVTGVSESESESNVWESLGESPLESPLTFPLQEYFDARNMHDRLCRPCRRHNRSNHIWSLSPTASKSFAPMRMGSKIVTH